MTVFIILSSLLFVFYLQTGAFMLWKNREAPLNRWFFGIALYLAIFSFINLILLNKDGAGTQTYFLRLAGYGALTLLLFRFHSLLTGYPRNRVVQDVLFFFFLLFGVGLSLFLFTVLYSFDSSRLYLLQDWFWTSQFVFMVHYGLLAALAVLVLIMFYHWRKNIVWRKQKKRLLIVLPLVLFYGIVLLFSDLFISDSEVLYYLRMPQFFLIPWFITIGYGFVQYRFLPPDPAKASRKLLLELKQVLFFCDEDGYVLETNPFAAQLTGRRIAEIRGVNVSQLFIEDGEIIELLLEAKINDDVGPLSVMLRSRDGMNIPVLLAATTLKDKFNDQYGIAIYGTDQREALALKEEINRLKEIETSLQNISGDLELQVEKHTEELRQSLEATRLKIIERKRVEESVKMEINDMEVMMEEIQSRVKNNINIILNLLRLKSSKTAPLEVRIREKTLYQRINTILLLNNQVLTNENYGLVAFRRFIDSLVDAYRDPLEDIEKIKIEINSASALLWVDQAIPLALVANELINNSIHHAFVNKTDKDAVLKVVFSIADSNVCTLEVHDNGSGFAPENHLTGNEYSGLQLVRMLVEDQLNGSLEIDQDNGVRARIMFPLDQQRQGHIGVN